jgi:hypothetical protein
VIPERPQQPTLPDERPVTAADIGSRRAPGGGCCLTAPDDRSPPPPTSRKAAKRLRYAAELTAPALGRKAKRLTK